MPVPRNFLRLIFVLVLGLPALAFADTQAGVDAGPTAPPASKPATEGLSRTAASLTPAERDAIKRELMEEVRHELDKTKADLDKQKEEFRQEITYAESEADARNYDASLLKDLQQQVNLLQLNGYFRLRGDLFNNASLGRGPDQTGRYLFPYLTNTSLTPSLNTLGSGDMRLRLEPTLRVADFITVHAQIDVLDNVVFGGDPLVEPSYAEQFAGSANTVTTVTPSVLANQIAANAVNVKRVWAEVTLPFGHIAFGRMGFHWGEGMYYNDGNCLDCDYGNTFDRLLIASNPFANHVLTITGDMLGQGVVTDASATQAYGQAFPIDELAGAYRFGFQLQRILTDFDRKRRADNGDWIVEYGILGAYRTQGYETVANTNIANGVVTEVSLPIKAQFGEGDIYYRIQKSKLRLAGEFAIFGGQEQDRLFNNNGVTTSIPNSPLNYLEGAALVRAKYFFLKKDSLFIGLDAGWASGDKQPGMGVRTYVAGSGPNGSTVRGNIDGPKYDCSQTSCVNNDITNFAMNPDFRVDELMWRYIFTQVSGAYFGRLYAGFKPDGRASGGGDDYGLDLNLNLIYSQAVYASETPSGRYTPLGFEIDANGTYTTRAGLYTGFTAGILIPLDGLNNYNVSGTALSASVGEVFRGFIGVRF